MLNCCGHNRDRRATVDFIRGCIPRGRSDETFPVYRKRDSSSALRSQRGRAGRGNLRHCRRIASDVLSMAAAVRWIERSGGDGDERPGRGKYSAAGPGQQSLRASSSSAARCRIFAGCGSDGPAFSQKGTRAATGGSNRRREMRRSSDRTVCIGARQSLTAQPFVFVKNARRVTLTCSSSLSVVHKYHNQSARLISLCRSHDAIWRAAQDRTFSVCSFFLRNIRGTD